MRVLIISKTRMGSMACVGGLTIDSCQNVRLLQPNKFNQPADTAYKLGDIWDLNYLPRQDVIHPHIEDVLVYRGKKIGEQLNLREYLLSKMYPWKGGPESLFGGAIRFTFNGTGYISRKNDLPTGSVGFWIPFADLQRVYEGNKVRYLYVAVGQPIYISYVGSEPAIEAIPRGSLLRVSLARWWRPPDAPNLEERCYLQLSGWYGIYRTTEEINSCTSDSQPLLVRTATISLATDAER